MEMDNQKVWNHKYVAGDPDLVKTVRENRNNPMRKANALEAARESEVFGWRTWVENTITGQRIFSSEQEERFQFPT